MWQTRYALAVPKNLGLGQNFLPCSEGYFLSGCPQSVAMANDKQKKNPHFCQNWNWSLLLPSKWNLQWFGLFCIDTMGSCNYQQQKFVLTESALSIFKITDSLGGKQSIQYPKTPSQLKESHSVLELFHEPPFFGNFQRPIFIQMKI